MTYRDIDYDQIYNLSNVGILQDPAINSITNCLLNGIGKGKKFDQATRIFTINIRYLSPRAYDYLRTKFNDTLPHPMTIRKWFAYSNVTGAAFHDAALQTLKNLVAELKNKDETMYVAISFD